MSTSSALFQRFAPIAALTVIQMGGLGNGAAHAQGYPSAPPPVFTRIDTQGVDLISGSLNVSSPDVSIGQGIGALSYVRTYIGSGWVDNQTATLSIGATAYIVSFGGSSESFSLSGGVYTPNQGQGSTLTFDGAQSYTYTAADGTVVLFSTTLAGQSPAWVSARATQATHPNGLIVTYTYQTTSVNGVPATRLQSVNNNLGYQLKFSYQSDSNTNLTTWQTLANVIGVNNGVAWCDPTANNCNNLLSGNVIWPRAVYATNAGPPMTVTKTDAKQQVTTFTYDSLGRLTSLQTPAATTSPTGYNYNGATNQVATVSNGTGAWNYNLVLPDKFHTDATMTVTDPLNHTRVVVSTYATSLVSTDTDGNGHTTSYLYGGYSRLTQVTLPEGNSVQYGYDGRGNVTTTTRIAVPGTGLANIVTSANFDEPTCVYPATCNKPNSTIDANQNETDYTYDNIHGVLLTVTPPAPTTGAVRPQIRYSYSPQYAWYLNSGGAIVQAATSIDLLTGTSKCQTTASCAGTADEVKQTIAYAPGSSTASSNLALSTSTTGAGNGTPQSPSTASYATTFDVIGNLTTVQGPLGAAQTSQFFYDGDRELSGFVAPNPGASESLPYPALRYTYNGDGHHTLIESGTVVSQSAGDFANFIGQRSQATTYDGVGRKSSDLYGGTDTGGAYVDTSFIQYGFDNANNLKCVATRMNHVTFGSLSTPACSQGTPGASPPDSMADMITAYNYDPGNRLTSMTKSSGTQSNPSSIAYETLTYTLNGLVTTLVDANNNETYYEYDGFDRLIYKYFPLSVLGAGAYDPNNYEAYVYDNNGNVTEKRLRGLTPAQDIYYDYDALNRLTEKIPPSGTTQPVFYGYDLLSRLLSATYQSPTGPGVAFTYDALGRTLTSTASGQQLQYQYDQAGDRTSITWPDAAPNALTAQYDYDFLGRVTEIDANPPSTGVNILAKYAYDAYGHRTQVARAGGAGATTSLGYDLADRIKTLTQNFAGTAADLTLTSSYSYNPSPQIYAQTGSNDTYTYQASALNKGYQRNGLNQYSQVAGGAYSYDSRGNQTSNFTNSYTYDPENHLLTASGPTAVTLTYDPLGRVRTSTASGTTTSFLFDGDNLVEENNSTGGTLRRYVPGPGTDEPVVWYQGAGLANARWLAADTQGSIIGYSDSAGNSGATYKYDPYGNPASWSGSRYSYTGQLMIPEAHLYYYKSRIYDPANGRFLQTDPIDYAADVNLYAYLGNDPRNGRDPSGLEGCDTWVPAGPDDIGGPVACIGASPISGGDGLIGGGLAGVELGGNIGPQIKPPRQYKIQSPVCSALQVQIGKLGRALDNLADAASWAELGGGIATFGFGVLEPATAGGDTLATATAGSFTVGAGVVSNIAGGLGAAADTYASNGDPTALGKFSLGLVIGSAGKAALGWSGHLGEALASIVGKAQDLVIEAKKNGC